MSASKPPEPVDEITKDLADDADHEPSDSGEPESGVRGAVWGDFTIERRIGRGGMGAIYLARQSGLDRQVALKVLPKKLGKNAEFRQRFATEAKAAGRISSPHVVGVHACGEHAGRLWYAMEYIEGQDLRLRLDSGWHPDWREALLLMAQAARGLAAAHGLGLVHRDVKPANLILSHSGELKVADFGLVRVREERRPTSTGQVMGSMIYIAPEQARGEACDQRADLYSLGCVLYELLCRRPPFIGEGMAALISQHLHDPPTSPRQHAPYLPKAVDGLVVSLLAKRPEQRPGDASALARELERLARSTSADARNMPRRVIASVGGLALIMGVGWWWSEKTAEPAAEVSPVSGPTPQKPMTTAKDGVSASNSLTTVVAVPDKAEKPVPSPNQARDVPPEVAKVDPLPSLEDEQRQARQARVERNRAAAAMVAVGDHLGPVDDLLKRLGKPDGDEVFDGRRILTYGDWDFTILDGLVLSAKERYRPKFDEP